MTRARLYRGAKVECGERLSDIEICRDQDEAVLAIKSKWSYYCYY